MKIRPSVVLLGVLALTGSADGSPVVFENDYAGFAAGAGTLSTIDFNTLPDGQPSHAGVHITNAFNYDLMGAHFVAPLGSSLVISGNAVSGYGLLASVQNPAHTWLTANLTAPATAVGFFFPGATTFIAFDQNQQSIAMGEVVLGGTGHFLGVVSDVPIYSILIDRGSFAESMDSFVFHSVPEPTSVLLCGMAGLVSARRRRREMT